MLRHANRFPAAFCAPHCNWKHHFTPNWATNLTSSCDPHRALYDPIRLRALAGETPPLNRDLLL